MPPRGDHRRGNQIPVPLDTQAMLEIAQITGGYETTHEDVSRPSLIAGTLIVIIGSTAALLITTRIP